MPSPYGSRSAGSYYQYGGLPHHYAVDWKGMPPGGHRAAETRALGGDYLDITARFHKDLGEYADYPVAMSLEKARRSVLHSGPEQTHIYDGLGLFGVMSGNEKRLLMLGGAAVAGWLAWQHFKKKRKR